MKRCVFCKSSEKITKEHIFPIWYRNLNKIELKTLHHLSFEHPTQRLLASKNISEMKMNLKSERRYPINSLVNGYVCKKCNNIFINKIDGNAKNIVSKLLNGNFKKGDFTEENCKELSMWAYKTILTLCHPNTINFKKLIPGSAYEDFFVTKEVPDDVIISLGKLKKESKNTEALWSISQNFLFEFSPHSFYARDIVKESTFILNQKKSNLSATMSFLKKCNKDSFHVILNINGFLLRVVYIPRTDLFSLRYDNGEIIVHPKLTPKMEDIVEYENMLKFMLSLHLVYKGIER